MEQRSGTTHTNRVLAGSTRGDKSILIRERYPTRNAEGQLAGGDEVRLISVVRTGAIVVVLYENGWEAGWSACIEVISKSPKGRSIEARYEVPRPPMWSRSAAKCRSRNHDGSTSAPRPTAAAYRASLRRRARAGRC